MVFPDLVQRTVEEVPIGSTGSQGLRLCCGLKHHEVSEDCKEESPPQVLVLRTKPYESHHEPQEPCRWLRKLGGHGQRGASAVCTKIARCSGRQREMAVVLERPNGQKIQRSPVQTAAAEFLDHPFVGDHHRPECCAALVGHGAGDARVRKAGYVARYSDDAGAAATDEGLKTLPNVERGTQVAEFLFRAKHDVPDVLLAVKCSGQ